MGELVPRQLMFGEGGGGEVWVWAAGVAAHILCKYFLPFQKEKEKKEVICIWAEIENDIVLVKFQ